MEKIAFNCSSVGINDQTCFYEKKIATRRNFYEILGYMEEHDGSLVNSWWFAFVNQSLSKYLNAHIFCGHIFETIGSFIII